MPRRTIATALAVVVGCMAGAAGAEPVKIALIETLSGGQAVTGKLFQSSVKYGLAKLEAEKAWPDGIKLLEYDNQGGPSEAADKLKAAKPERIAAIAGDLAGAEEMFALGHLLVLLGSPNFDCRQDGAKLDPRLGRASYLFNTTIEGIERADAILLVGVNPRLEAAVLNVRLRKRWRQGNAAVGLIGERVDLSYPYEYLGAGAQTLKDLGDGKHSFAATLRDAKHPLVIVGAAAAARLDGAAVLATAARIALAAGQGKLAGKIVRIGHMGIVDPKDIEAAVANLATALERLGYKKPAAVG